MPEDTSQSSSADTPLAGMISNVYQELRALAHQFFQSERDDHTLQPTALVHEVYVRMSQQRKQQWSSRSEFIGAAACMIRRILVDHARRRHAAKRGGGRRPAALDDALPAPPADDESLLALDEALTRLADLDLRKSRIIELRFFGGLSEEETAQALDVSPRTVRREWRLARAWLHRELGGG